MERQGCLVAQPSRSRGGSNPWDGLIVLCAANSYDAVKLADRHIAEQLANLAPVLYVDPPLSLLTARNHPELADSVKRPRLRIVKPGLARFTPVVQPFPSRRGMVPVSCGETVKMYWAQDDFVGGAVLLGLDGVGLAASEQRIAAAADVIVAANPLVADTWRDRGYQPFLIPFGVDDGAYLAVDEAPSVQDVNLPGPIAGFVGHINERIDLRLLESIADRGRSLLLVGPRRPSFEPDRTNRLLARPNVSWVGPKHFDELPSYLKAIDVGLVAGDRSGRCGNRAGSVRRCGRPSARSSPHGRRRQAAPGVRGRT
jgi:teichuronic acid biosynthesis glycosyltransferase TuaH